MRHRWREFPILLKIGTILALIAAFALVGLEMYQTVVRGRDLRDSRELVIHTYQVITAAQQLERTIHDAERGQRGYLLTDDRRYLEPYEEAIGQISALEDQLRRLTFDSQQQNRLSMLQQQVDMRLAELKRTIDVNDTQGFAAAKAIVATGTGLQAMRDISGLFDTIIGAENTLLTQRVDHAAQGEQEIGRAFVISSFLALLIMALGAALAGLAFREWTRQQRALEQTRAQLAQSQKLEALGQLTGGIAHDFNNLLQGITGALSILQQRLPDPGHDASSWIDMIKRNAERAATLTQRLLAFSRRQPLNPKLLDLNRLVRGMADILHKSIGETVILETVLSAGLWTTQADANELETAVLNLVLNARDAMPTAGGKITIETGNVFLDDNYSQREGLTPGQYVMIAVSDDGIGMTKDTIQKAFEPFFTTKTHGKGTGLGLSQVHGFIKQSGGHVKIYSEVGEGTSVKIYLPRFADGKAAQPEEQSMPETAVEGTETILVVEDDEDVRKFVATILSDKGFRVLTAADADAGLQQLRQDSSVALLLTDVGLPGSKNGRKLADEACELNRSIKVLFMTGYAKNAIIHHGRLDPGVHLLAKPFTDRDLSRKLQEVLRSPD